MSLLASIIGIAMCTGSAIRSCVIFTLLKNYISARHGTLTTGRQRVIISIIADVIPSEQLLYRPADPATENLTPGTD